LITLHKHEPLGRRLERIFARNGCPYMTRYHLAGGDQRPLDEKHLYVHISPGDLIYVDDGISEAIHYHGRRGTPTRWAACAV
jgi:hypothetical protein